MSVSLLMFLMCQSLHSLSGEYPVPRYFFGFHYPSVSATPFAAIPAVLSRCFLIVHRHNPDGTSTPSFRPADSQAFAIRPFWSSHPFARYRKKNLRSKSRIAPPFHARLGPETSMRAPVRL